MKKICEEFLMEQFGDQDVVNEIYTEYVKSVNEKIAEAEGALASDAWTTLDQVAHAVKGNSLATGDTDVANTAIALRNAAKLMDHEEARTLVDKLKALATEL